MLQTLDSISPQKNEVKNQALPGIILFLKRIFKISERSSKIQLLLSKIIS